jgi:hypothetical protein
MSETITADSGALAMSAYDEFLDLRTDGGGVGHGLVEQGIIRRLV